LDEAGACPRLHTVPARPVALGRGLLTVPVSFQYFALNCTKKLFALTKTKQKSEKGAKN